MDRYKFLELSALSSLGMFAPSLNKDTSDINSPKKRIKPISGAWFEFQHLLPKEGRYWNPAMAKFSAEQWRQKVYETSTLGFEYLIIQEVALNGKSFYPSKFAPQYKLNCADPLEAMMSAADKFGIKIFIGNGYWGSLYKPKFLMTDPGIREMRIKTMTEIAENYGHHDSFYGWYFPNETHLMPYFSDVVINYVNECSNFAKQLTPACVTLIAPYNVKDAVYDKKFVNQLEKLNVDIIAYQDGVGVKSTKLEKDGQYFRILHEAHQKASRARIWADMEIFYFEDETKGNLLAADFSRVQEQMKQLSPFVDKILCYEYTGLFNMPDTTAFAGDPYGKSKNLYKQYKSWYDSGTSGRLG